MNGLVKYTNNKLDTIPFRGLPSDSERQTKVLELGVYLDGLLSLSGEKSVKRLEVLLPMVEDFCWGLSLAEIKQAFHMYVKGDLPIEPIDNYLTVILFSKVINEYKQKRQKTTKTTEMAEPTQEEKETLTLLGIINCFDEYKQTNSILDGFTWVYDHLDEIKVINYSDDEKRKIMPIARERLIILSKNRMDLDMYKRFMSDLEGKRKEGAVIVQAKKMLLERFFSSLIAKDKHIKDLL